MASRRVRLVVAGALAAVLGAGCASSGGSAGSGLPPHTAAALAARAEHVAAALEAGACDQAREEASSLQSDVAALQLDPAVQAEAADRAARLVAAINCVPTTTTTAPTVPTDDPRPGKGKKHKGGDEHDD
jgi:hypothetical protein